MTSSGFVAVRSWASRGEKVELCSLPPRILRNWCIHILLLAAGVSSLLNLSSNGQFEAMADTQHPEAFAAWLQLEAFGSNLQRVEGPLAAGSPEHSYHC